MLKFCLCFRLSRKFLEYILAFIWGKRNNTFAQKCWIEKRQRITACTVGDKLKYNLRRFEIFLAVWTTAFRKRKRNISETKYKPIMRCLMYYTRLVFFKTTLLIAPIPIAKPAPPAVQRMTWSIPEFKGLTIGAMLKRNIPTPKERRMESHSFCFATTLIQR